MKQGYEHDVYLKLSILEEGEGFTIKDFNFVSYKTGWQVALYGEETTSAAEAVELVRKFNGTCGVWYSNGVYYVDCSKRIKTKKEALRIGRDNNQISIWGWARGVLAYC